MLGKILKLFVGDKSKKDLKLINPIIEKIHSFDQQMNNLSNDELRSQTVEFKNQINKSIATKDELIDYSIRTGAPLEVVENLQAIEDEGDLYESIQEIWPDYPTDDDYLWNEDEY